MAGWAAYEIRISYQFLINEEGTAALPAAAPLVNRAVLLTT